MKYAYIKYGDAVDELEKIGPSPSKVPLNGPLTFIAGFLQMVDKNPALLISWAGYSLNKRSKAGNIQAYTYKRPRGLLKFAAALKILGQLVRFRPDIVLCVHDGPGLWVAYIVCRLFGAIMLHSRQRAVKVAGDSWRRRTSIKIDRFVIRHAHGVICHGPFTRHQLTEIGVLESRIVEFDVRLDDFISAARSIPDETNEQPVSDRRKILFLGRVEKSKGVSELLEASIPVLKNRNNVDLIFVGRGAALQQLQQRVIDENLTSQVFFTGELPHKHVAVQLRDATALVIPTRRALEGWGMAAVEALSMGVPVIAPDAGPFQFMIQDRINGLLYPVDSVVELRKRIELILDNPGLRRELSFGAIKTSIARAQNIIDFGTALKLACSSLSK